jgi:hypothetical protein
VGSTLQYQVNGGNWSSTLPTYATNGPAQTIKTRCSCNLEVNVVGPVSAGVTTVPGNCNVQFTWLGITTDWNSPSNWSTGLVPTACSKVIVNTAGIPNKPTITGINSTCFSLTLQNGATVNLAKDAKLIITGK